MVAIAFGLVSGLILGRYRSERRAILLTSTIAVVVGSVAWLVEPDHIAGPSLTSGGICILIGITLSSRSLRGRPG